MNTITLDFPVYTSFGKGDNVDWELFFEVTEEEFNRMVEAAKECDEFDGCEEIADIYNKVYEATVAQAKEDTLENDPESIEDYLDEDETVESWNPDDYWSFGINFPYEVLEKAEEE